jgi:dipeptidyl aminopeptidase/acylaminoacyl peptidase
MGTDDEVFDISHMLKFGEKLARNGVQRKMIVAQGEGHAFDIWALIGGKVHSQILRPAVEWIAQVVGLRVL